MSKAPQLKQIETVKPLGYYRLAVAWRDGKAAVIDFSADIKSGGVWQGLYSEEKFAQARISQNGRVLEWPEPADDDGEPLIDIDADALSVLANQQMMQPLFEAVIEQLRRR